MGSDAESALEERIAFILSAIAGEGLNLEAKRNTPERVVRSFREIYGGYKMSPERLLKTTFVSDASEMVIVSPIPFFSMCEHHMLPIIGEAHIGYIPNGQIVGISKMPRLVECFARRLQLQERMTSQIADAFMEHVKPKGVGVVMSAEHTCMTMRGVNKPGARTSTSAMRGLFKDDPKTRAEFLRLIELGGRRP